MEQCKICRGSGLVERDQPFFCNRHPLGVIACMYCENVPKGIHVTCDKCTGTGEVKKKGAPPQINMIR